MGLTKKTALNDNDILAAILRVDGTGSGIDADMVNGSHAADLVPHIDSITKHWIIQNTDTGILAEGVAGSNGTNGTNGTDGITPHIDPTTKHWFIGTTDTGIVAEGVDGSSTTVSEVSVTLTAASWVGSQAPYTQSVTVTGMTTTKSGFTGISQSATAAQRAVASSAKLAITSQGTNTITITADGAKPSLDIPIVVTLLG